LVFHAEDECTISGSQELLYRAIENVVRNTIRYTESGSEVEIRRKATTGQEARQAEIEVSDRGPGIPKSQLNAIFRPFYRVD
jgi:signal transduction histidine kinase